MQSQLAHAFMSVLLEMRNLILLRLWMLNYRGVGNNLGTFPFKTATPGLSSLLSAEVTGRALSWESMGGRLKRMCDCVSLILLQRKTQTREKLPCFVVQGPLSPYLPEQVEDEDQNRFHLLPPKT